MQSLHLKLTTVVSCFALGLGSRAREATAVQAELDSLLDTIEFVDLDDGAGGTARTLRVSGANVQVVNGLGATNGAPADPASIDPGVTAVNGAGNVIVGYGETIAATDRSGSHNLLVGLHGSASRFGALGAGRGASAGGAFAAVLGGRGGEADGDFATVTGGRGARAETVDGTAGGGFRAFALGPEATTLGGGTQAAGSANVAAGERATCAGGLGGNATAEGALSLGGHEAGGGESEVTGPFGTLAGGDGNLVAGEAATILGGTDRALSGQAAVLADGGGDGWLRVDDGGDTLLQANADRVTVGAAGNAVPLHVDGETRLLGDVAVGAGMAAVDDREELVLRGSGTWSLGGVVEDDGPFEILAEGDPRAAISTAGDLLVGPSGASPGAALHAAAAGARILLESVAAQGTWMTLATAEEGTARVGYDERGDFLLERTDRERPPGVALTLDGRVSVRNAALEVEGPANLLSDLVVGTSASFEDDVVVVEHTQVTGNLRAGGLDAGLVPPTLTPYAWGSIDANGDALAGSGNWRTDYIEFGSITIQVDGVEDNDDYLIFATPTQGTTLIWQFATAWAEPGYFRIYGTDDIPPQPHEIPRGWHFILFAVE